MYVKIIGKDVAWTIYKDAMLQRFGNVQNMQFLSKKILKQTGTIVEYYDAFKSLFDIVSFLSDMGSAEIHFVDPFIEGLCLGIGNVVRKCDPKSLWSAYFFAKWDKSSETVNNDIANEVLDEISNLGDEGKGFEVSDAYVKESIEVENILVEDVVVETINESVEVENKVSNDDKVSDDMKVTTSKSVNLEFLVMEVDGFMTDSNISNLCPYKNNRSLVHRKKGFHLLRRFVDKMKDGKMRIKI
nr:hypothetical protein [Tanacetum cinerariifolium]